MNPVDLTRNLNETIHLATKQPSTDFKTDKANVLVIGGAGYIGSVLTRKLLSKGYSIRVLDKLIYGNGSSISNLIEDKAFSFIYGDFGDEEVLEQSLENVTDVVLLAALVGDPVCKKYPDLARKVNVDYPKQLIEKMNGKRVSKFIFTSTCSNYGLRKDDSPATEDSELNPQSLYAETKIETENYILDNLNRFDFSPTILRLSTAFGVSGRMRFDLTISEFTKELALGKELIVYDENTWRPYCNVTDISEAIIRVLESPEQKVFGQVFNVGGNGNNYTKKMILDLIGKHVKQARIEYRKGGFDPRNYRVSFDKLKEVLDFEPHINAEDSIIQIARAIENNLFSDVEERKNLYGNYEIRN